MFYEIHGRGRPLLLLHGGAGDGQQFDDLVPEFSRHFRVIVPDARAQGRTTDGPGPLTYHGMAEDFVALMDRLGIRRADVLGWSDGGIVGLDLAIHHPTRVGHLIAFGANFTPEGVTPDAAAWTAGASATSFGPLTRVQYEQIAPDPSHYEIAMEKILAMWRAEPNFSFAQLGSIRARTMIAAGEHDLIQPEHTEALARAIPGARLWIVPDAGHAAIQQKPDLVGRVVLDFLQDGAASSSPQASEPPEASRR